MNLVVAEDQPWSLIRLSEEKGQGVAEISESADSHVPTTFGRASPPPPWIDAGVHGIRWPGLVVTQPGQGHSASLRTRDEQARGVCLSRARWSPAVRDPTIGRTIPTNPPGGPMQAKATPPTTENELYLKLFITNGGGW